MPVKPISSGRSSGTVFLTTSLMYFGFADEVNQNPSGLDTPLVMNFGPAQGTGADRMQILADGTLMFNEDITWIYSLFPVWGRSGASGGQAVMGWGAFLNGIQPTASFTKVLSTPGEKLTQQLTESVSIAKAGDIVQFILERAASGVNQGGLETLDLQSATFENVLPVFIIIYETTGQL